MDEFAQAIIEADAWASILYLARFVLSAAISTSTILPLAAAKFLACKVALSDAYCNLDIVPPLSARRVAKFSKAFVKTPTDISSSLIPSAYVSDANVVALPFLAVPAV